MQDESGNGRLDRAMTHRLITFMCVCNLSGSGLGFSPFIQRAWRGAGEHEVGPQHWLSISRTIHCVLANANRYRRGAEPTTGGGPY